MPMVVLVRRNEAFIAAKCVAIAILAPSRTQSARVAPQAWRLNQRVVMVVHQQVTKFVDIIHHVIQKVALLYRRL
jgi:hypothetical protein